MIRAHLQREMGIWAVYTLEITPSLDPHAASHSNNPKLDQHSQQVTPESASTITDCHVRNDRL